MGNKKYQDHFFFKAKTLGYRSRSAFKLIEMDKKFKFLDRKKLLLDLGSSPGGWSQVVSQIIKSGKIIALDKKKMDKVKNVTFLNKDFLIIATVAISAVLILGLFVMPFSGAVPTPQPAYTYGGDDKGDGGGDAGDHGGGDPGGRGDAPHGRAHAAQVVGPGHRGDRPVRQSDGRRAKLPRPAPRHVQAGDGEAPVPLRDPAAAGAAPHRALYAGDHRAAPRHAVAPGAAGNGEEGEEDDLNFIFTSRIYF